MTHTSTTSQLRRTLALVGLGAALAAGLTGCRNQREDEPPHQFLPDMDDSPKFKPQTQTEFFADQRAMRPKVKGTVAFGDSSRMDDRSRDHYRRESPELWEGVDPNGKPLAEGEPAYLEHMPAAALDEFRAVLSDRGVTFASDGEAMRAMVQRGRERFNIYCSACHGFKGEGGDPGNFIGGVVGRRWKSPVPSYHDPKYADASVRTGRDGYIFHVIRNGVPNPDPTKAPNMPSYADKVNEVDAWAVVSYIRSLQKAWHDPTGTAPAPAAPPRTGNQPATTPAQPEGSK